MNLMSRLAFEIFSMWMLMVQAKVPLLYPNTGGTYKWIIGFGVPWDDLVFETISSGIVWRFHFRLPGSVEQLRHRTVTKLGRNMDGSASKIPYLWEEINDGGTAARNATQQLDKKLELAAYALSNYRWGIYKSLEGVAERMGLNGRDCMLKSICEVAEDPLHFGNGLWAELVHILLTPSSSVDTLSEHSDNEYYYAEHMGRSAADCERVFKNCQRSLLDQFSNFYKLSNDLAKFL